MATQPKTRKVKTQPYKSFKLSKRIKHTKPVLTSSFKIFRAALAHLKKHKRLFFGITLVYLLLTVVLVKGFGVTSGVTEIKDTLTDVFTGTWGGLTTSATLFAVMLTTSGSTNGEAASLFQTALLVICSLAIIWALRQTHASHKVTTRDSFYKGMYPLVPFLLVTLVIILQLLPVLLSTWIYGTVIAGGIAVNGAEQAIWWIVIGFLVLSSLYMLTSSIFALYIVTLPDMTPLKALRSARELVRYRRWTVMRKVLALPLLLLIVGALIMLPLIMWLTPLAEWTFFILNMAVLAIVHAYVYALYRELL